MKKYNTDLKRLEFNVPFNLDFNKKIKKAGGRFDGSKKIWWIDLEAESIADDILKEVYGFEENAELVDVKAIIDFKNTEFDKVDGGGVAFLGRTIIYSVSRDYKKISDGIRIISGTYYESGGSARWPSIEFDEKEPFIFQISNVYKSKVDEYFENHENASEFIEVISKSESSQIERLKIRKAELLKELELLNAEIEVLEKQ